MLFKLLSLIKGLFKARSEQELIDEFISSHHPTTVCEVEHWLKVYDQRKSSAKLATYWR